MMITIISLLLIAYLGLGIGLYFAQSALTFRPIKQTPYRPDDIGLEYQDIKIKTPDGNRINGWFIPAEQNAPTVMFCHGNAANITYNLDMANILNELGLNCMLFDYRGYGRSNGKPDEQGLYADAECVYRWLVEEKKIPPQDIIIIGRSLGAAVAANLAAKVKPKTLIIESAFTSFYDIAHKSYPYFFIKPFLKYNFNTIECIKKINCPLLVIHSRNDEIVPFQFGLRIYDAAKQPKDFIEIFGSHNDGFLYSGQLYKNAITNWLCSIEKIRQQNNQKNIKLSS